MKDISVINPLSNLEQANLVLGNWLDRLQYRKWRADIQPNLWIRVFDALNILALEADRLKIDASLFRKLYEFALGVSLHKDTGPIIEIPDETWRQAALVYNEIMRALQKENTPEGDDPFPPLEFVDPATGKRADFSKCDLLWHLFKALYEAKRRLEYSEIQELVPPWRGQSLDEETIPGAAKRLKTLLRNAGMKRHANAITQGGRTLCYKSITLSKPKISHT